MKVARGRRSKAGGRVAGRLAATTAAAARAATLAAAVAATLAPTPLLLATPVAAHEGPPYPIIVDRPVGPWIVSVWTDPDIGIGTFIVVLEPRDDAGVPPGTRVRVAIRPVSGRLTESVHPALPQEVRYGERHLAEVPFDRGELWDVRFIIEAPGGGGELAARVEATPDGVIGPIGMVLYLLPFLAVGWIWLRVALRKRELGREAEPEPEAGAAAG